MHTSRRSRSTRRFTATLATLTLLGAAALSGCEWDEGGARDDGPHPLIGAWRTMSMEVYLEARDDRAGATRALAVSGDEWETTLGLSPPERHFTEDGLYETIYRDAAGHEVERSTGYWVEDGRGRVTLVQVEPSAERQELRFTMQGDLLAEFETWVDWNSSGEANDLQITSQRRLRASELVPPER